MIFIHDPSDIAPPEYPILISTPQERHTDTPSTIREGESLRKWFNSSPNSSEIPLFNSSTDNDSPRVIKVRLVCIALVLLNPKSAEDVRKGVLNRHNWLHRIIYKFDKATWASYNQEMDITDVLGNINYYQHLYINMISTEGITWDAEQEKMLTDPIWTQNQNSHWRNLFDNLWPRHFFWLLPQLEMIIKYNPPCRYFYRKTRNNPLISDLKDLESAYRTGMWTHCQELYWRVEFENIGIASESDLTYFGPPWKLSSLIYPVDPMGQLFHRSILTSTVATVLPNSTLQVTYIQNLMHACHLHPGLITAKLTIKDCCLDLKSARKIEWVLP